MLNSLRHLFMLQCADDVKTTVSATHHTAITYMVNTYQTEIMTNCID